MADFAPGNAPILNSAGEQTNPTTATVLADTGAVPYGGYYEARVIVSADATAQFDVQRRNAANGANVGSVVTFYCPANDSRQIVLLYTLEAGERIRVMVNQNLTGVAVATVQVEQRQ